MSDETDPIPDTERRGRRANPKLAKTVAKLRDEYLSLIRDGLGVESLGVAEERDRLNSLEEQLADIFYLHAKVQVAKVLGITDWLRATVTGQFPDSPYPPEEDE